MIPRGIQLNNLIGSSRTFIIGVSFCGHVTHHLCPVLVVSVLNNQGVFLLLPQFASYFAGGLAVQALSEVTRPSDREDAAYMAWSWIYWQSLVVVDGQFVDIAMCSKYNIE